MQINKIYPSIIALVLIVLGSYLISNLVDKSYDFGKLVGFLTFYYAIIVLLSFGATNFLKIRNGNLIGSVLGFIVSVLLWFKFGNKAKK
jgi:hypothetical protein